VVGELVEDGAVGVAVADAEPQRIGAGEDVELGHREGGHPVEADRVAEGDDVEPPAAPGTPGGGSDLPAALAKALTDLVG
jgi:hypothetical protein